MADLSIAHRAALAHLIEHVPDAVLRTLGAAVASMPGARARALGLMLTDEATDRRRRAFVLNPISPMFGPRPDAVEGLSFPPAVLPRLWQVASRREPGLLSRLDDEDAEALAVADRICAAAAAAVRDQPDLVWPAGVQTDGRSAGLAALAGCLDLAHLARRGVPSLGAWIGRPDGDQLAELRLLVRDCAAVAPDGAQRLLEILFAHLADAVLILRIVTQTSGAAGREAFLSQSELADFVERLIVRVNARVDRIAAYKPGADATPLSEIMDDMTWSSTVLNELDVTLQLQPGSPWGKSVRDARVRIARQLTGLLRSADKAVDAALPLIRVQLSGRMTRQIPNLEASADGEPVAAARSLLALVAAVRGPAGVFGCEADRKQLVESITGRLSTYADEALNLVNGGEVGDETQALRLIELTAEFLETIEAADPARTVRRRVAVAGAPVMQDKASPAAA